MGRTLDTGWRLAMLLAAGLAGSALQLQRADVLPVVPALLLATLAGGAAWWGRRWLLWLLPCVALAAFALTEARAGWRLAEVLPPALIDADLRLQGRIVSLPQPGLTGTRFEFEVDEATHAGQPVTVPRRVSLGWYRGFEPDALLAAPLQDLRAGQRWAFTARLRPPHGSANPHGFDLELWLFERGLRASGTVRATTADAPVLLAAADGQWVHRLRQHLREAIAARVPDARAAGVLAALVVGDQGAIERNDWDLFRNTGVAHLMAISGLHITMFAWLAAALLGKLWRRTGRGMLLLPAPVVARWGGLALAAVYALLAGWGVPAQRTLWMLATVAVLQSAGLRWPGPLVLLAAAGVVTWVDPWALFQPGFWLSFGAVGLLMLTSAPPPPNGPWRARVAAALRTGLRTQAVATVGLAPLTLLFFQQVSLVGFAANLLAIPLVTLVVTPLALAGAVLPPLWTLAAAAVQALVALLQPLGSWPVWTAAVAPPWAAAAGLLGGALLVLPLPWRLRVLGLPLLLPMVVPLPERPAEGRFELVALDVGQGTAVLLRTRRHLLVYDTGPLYSPEADAGQRILLPLLRARGERQVDLLVLSHRDSDHVGGANSLLGGLPVRGLFSSLELAHPLRALPLPHQPCQAGQRWAWDGVLFELLHPPDLPDAAGPAAKPNTLSCVLRVVDAHGASVLLTGDIEAAQEAALALAAPAALASTVLMVPHHGSKTSSSAVFLDAVQPRIAFVQAGYRSRFGHPAPAVLARYAQRGIGLRRSDICGAWTWHGSGDGRCQRQQARRYWHHPP
ncbi:MAG: DNA internalization-related competence protein ComEC/Rec2 [Rubrivivax sp.]|nr:DNA internalization-related competence protein ComEC/Rec2 [Rubrivivax sp.]